MRILIYLSLVVSFLNSALAASQVSVPSNWQKIEEKKGIVVYQDAADDKKLLTIAWLDLSDTPITRVNFKSEVAKMESSRRSINQWMGLENWKISRSDFEDGAQKKLSISGSYLKDGVEYLFWERQIFVGKKYRQVKIESLRSRAPSSEEITKTFGAIGFVHEN